jgi:purine-binding chemotaxis protein CheW
VTLAVHSLLLFQLDRELFAIPAASVREIARYRAYTPVPGAPHALPGIISQRGAIIPVVELRGLLNLPENQLERGARLVIAQHDEVEMALIVESVIDLVDLPEDAVAPAPTAPDAARAGLLQGLAEHNGRTLALIDMDALLAALRGA